MIHLATNLHSTVIEMPADVNTFKGNALVRLGLVQHALELRIMCSAIEGRLQDSVRFLLH